MTKKFQDKLAEAATTAEESISNIRTVKAFSQEPKTAAGYAKDIDGSYQVGKNLALLYGMYRKFCTMTSFMVATQLSECLTQPSKSPYVII